MWKTSFIALSAGLVLAVGVGTSLAGQSVSDSGADPEPAAVRVAEQVAWSVDGGQPAAFAGSLRTLAAKARPKMAALRAQRNGSGQYITVNVRLKGSDQAANRLQMIVSAADGRLVGVTAPSSTVFFALTPDAPDFLPPPAGAAGRAAGAADTPLNRREVVTLADGQGAAGDGQGAAGDGQGAAAAVPGIQDVLGALNTLLQVVNGENVPIDQVINAAGIMAQVVGLLLG